MCSLSDFPSYWLALILRDATVLDVVHLAHTNRAMHARITSRAKCPCHRLMPMHDSHATAATRAFWAHWRAERPRGLIDATPYLKRNSVVCVHYALRLGLDAVGDLPSVLHWAAAGGHWVLVKRLLTVQHFFTAEQLWAAYIAACDRRHLSVARRLHRVPAVQEHLLDPFVRHYTRHAHFVRDGAFAS